MARNVVKLSHFGWLFLPLAVGFCVFGSSSCIQIGPSGDAGADAGADDTTTHTLGDQCTSIATEFCARASNPADCDQEEDDQACQDSWVSGCCGSHCNDTSSISEDAIGACVADLRSTDCSNIAAILGGDPDALPTSCQNVFGDP